MTRSESVATINAVVTSISPAKQSKCYRGELSDSESVIPLVTFDMSKRDKLEKFALSGKTVTLTKAQIGINKLTNRPEVIVKSYTLINENPRSKHYWQSNSKD